MPREKGIHKDTLFTEYLQDDVWIRYVIRGGYLGNMTIVSLYNRHGS